MKLITKDKQTTNTEEMLKEQLLQQANEELNSFQNLLKQCEIPLLYYILKTTTDQNHAMSVNEISEQLAALIPAAIPDDNYFPERTLRRKIDRLTALESSSNPAFKSVRQLLQMIFGGQIEYRKADGIATKKNTTGNGTQRRYYFNPILSSGDMDMILGSIQSNRYLSDEEKNYLLTRLRLLGPSFDYSETSFENSRYRHLFQIDTPSKKPTPKANAKLPVDASTLLSHIQAIHNAIQNDYQICVVYGIYDIKDNSNRVFFRERNDGRAYILNPYAMMWNDGEYYLIATHQNNQKPIHFRIDRILSVAPHTEPDSKEFPNPISRKPLPPALGQFFHHKSGQTPVFDAIKYTNVYPGMRIYNKSNLIDCRFECTPQSLQILIDYFGPDLRLGPSPIKHNDAEVDYKGRPQKFLTATIKNIQYENALGFCIQQSQHLTLLAPQQLVDDVKASLKEISERYDKLPFQNNMP